MIKDKRVGLLINGMAAYPEQTLSGRRIAASGAPLHMISEDEFVLFDIFPPADFDVQAALDEVKGAPAPVIVEAVNDATGETVEVPVLPEDQG